MTSSANSQATQPSAPARQKSHIRREAILEQTWQLISSRGYQATTVNTIIAELGISKGSFYHHFDSKEAVFTAVVARITEESSQRAAHDDSSTNAADRLSTFIRTSWQWVETHQQVSTDILRVMLRPENGELLNRIITTKTRVISPLFNTIIEQGTAQGVFAVSDVPLVTRVLLPMIMEFDLQLGRDALAGKLSVNECIHQLRFMQQVIERVLGAAPGALDAALPFENSDKKQLQRFLKALQQEPSKTRRSA